MEGTIKTKMRTYTLNEVEDLMLFHGFVHISEAITNLDEYYKVMLKSKTWHCKGCTHCKCGKK